MKIIQNGKLVELPKEHKLYQLIERAREALEAKEESDEQ